MLYSRRLCRYGCPDNPRRPQIVMVPLKLDCVALPAKSRHTSTKDRRTLRPLPDKTRKMRNSLHRALQYNAALCAVGVNVSS